MSNFPKRDSRYPYTYAADLIRGVAGYGREGIKLSRADASEIINAIAIATELDDRKTQKLVEDLAKFYLDNEEEIAQKGAAELFKRLGARHE